MILIINIYAWMPHGNQWIYIALGFIMIGTVTFMVKKTKSLPDKDRK